MPSTPAGGASRAPIELGQFVRMGGLDQWITIRGADIANPPLLILTGPGAAFSRMAPFFAPWEREFTLVQWDQPGAGATLAKNGAVPLSTDRLAEDAAGVAEAALAQLGAGKLVVLGISGGSILGLKLAKARPDLVGAFVGTGQIVHWARQAQASYQLAVERAQGDEAALAELRQIGPPPYDAIEREFVLNKYVNAQTAAEQAEFAGLDAATRDALAKPPAGASYTPAGLALPEPMPAAFAAYQALRGEIAAFDAWTLGRRLEVPLVFLQGDRDLYTPTTEVEAYAAWVEAPVAKVVLIPGGGHSAVFLREPFLVALNGHVRPLLR